LAQERVRDLDQGTVLETDLKSGLARDRTSDLPMDRESARLRGPA
jgi:hypothetical protein